MFRDITIILPNTECVANVGYVLRKPYEVDRSTPIEVEIDYIRDPYSGQELDIDDDIQSQLISKLEHYHEYNLHPGEK